MRRCSLGAEDGATPLLNPPPNPNRLDWFRREADIPEGQEAVHPRRHPGRRCQRKLREAPLAAVACRCLHLPIVTTCEAFISMCSMNIQIRSYPNSVMALLHTLSTVKPYSRITTSPGADAP